MSTFNKILRYTLKSETCHFRLCWFRGAVALEETKMSEKVYKVAFGSRATY